MKTIRQLIQELSVLDPDMMVGMLGGNHQPSLSIERYVKGYCLAGDNGYDYYYSDVFIGMRAEYEHITVEKWISSLDQYGYVYPSIILIPDHSKCVEISNDR